MMAQEIEMEAIRKRTGDVDPPLPEEMDSEESVPLTTTLLDDEDDDDIHKKTQVKQSKGIYHLLATSIPRLVIIGCLSSMVLLAFFIRWPLYYSSVFPSLLALLGDGQRAEVEPLAVSVAFILPFVLGGLVYYAQENFIRVSRQHKVVPLHHGRWHDIRQLTNFPTLDSIDLICGASFILLQLNCVAGKVLYDHYNGKLAKKGLMNRVGKALGMNGLLCICLAILLVSRSSFLHKFLSFPAERASKYHVWSSNFGFACFSLHGFIYAIDWYQKGELQKQLIPCFTCEWIDQYRALRNFSGTLSYVLLAIVFLGSLEVVRRKHFGRFALIHCVNVLFVTFGCVHYYPLVFWLSPCVIAYTCYRLLSFFRRQKASVVSCASISNDVLQLELRREATSGDFRPGQYVYLRVASVGRSWHPFSISSSPLRNRSSLQVDAKVQGPFTTKVLELVRANQLQAVDVDGYYGSALSVCPHLVLIGGGSGMTPFLSLLEHLQYVSEGKVGDVELPKTIWVIWTSRDDQFLEAHHELLYKVQQSSHWQSKMWLHVTSESDGGIDRYRPKASGRYAFSPALSQSALGLFFATSLGAMACMAVAYWNHSINELWYVKRAFLFVAVVVGAVVSGSVVLYFVGSSSPKPSQERVDDSKAPFAPSTPQNSAKTSSLHHHFSVQATRPDFASTLPLIHADIRELYGPKADVRIYVCGPHSLQQSVVQHASKLSGPLFPVHKKSFAL